MSGNSFDGYTTYCGSPGDWVRNYAGWIGPGGDAAADAFSMGSTNGLCRGGSSNVTTRIDLWQFASSSSSESSPTADEMNNADAHQALLSGFVSFDGAPDWQGSQPFGVDLTFSPGSTDNTLVATADQSVTGSGYDIEIFDADDLYELAECSSGTTCTGLDDETSDRDFIAYIAAPSDTAPPPDIQAEAVPDGMYADLSNIDVTGSEIATWLPSGDPDDKQAPRPSGDVYRDALFPFVLHAFNLIHGFAVAQRAQELKDQIGSTQTVKASLGWYSRCDPGVNTRVSGIPSGGPNNGLGYPDITAQDAQANLSVWEMKYDSESGRMTAASQLSRYVTAANAPDSVYSSASPGPPSTDVLTNSFTLSCPAVLPANFGPIQVTTYSSYSSESPYQGLAGLEVYRVSMNDVYELAAALAAAKGITKAAVSDGSLTERHLADGSVQVVLNGNVERWYQAISVDPGVVVITA